MKKINGKQGAMGMNLCPAQQRTFDMLIRMSAIGNIFLLSGNVGSGKTSVLEKVHSKLGGAFLNMRNFTNLMHSRHPLTFEETFEKMVMEALISNDTVIVDDLQMFAGVLNCNYSYPRLGYYKAP